MSLKTKKSPFEFLRGRIIPLIIFVAIAVIFITGLNTTRQTQNSEEKKLLEDSIKRAVVTCYATTGAYPDSLEMLSKEYNVKINEDKYIVHYEIFASNIMPDITIVEKDGGSEA